MARISTYPIISTPTLNDLLIGTDVDDLNITKNFLLGDVATIISNDFVPYVGATGNVNLGVFSIEAASFIVEGGLASEFVKADGSLDSTIYTPQSRTLTINSVTFDLSANRSWDLNTIDTLTTTGTSGPATYIGKTLNIPQYQAQGNYITQLSGEATAMGPGNATVTLSNLAVISKVLTGLNITGGTVVDTDSILTAFGKVQNQINGLAGGVTYEGTWNAATNVPFLQSSVGVQGHYYVVSVAGTTNLNGITDWQLGDWAIFNGSVWEKVDNTDAVVSVNGYTGAVVLTFSDVGAPPATRNLTINGVQFDLTADRTWTVGDVRTDQTYANPTWITSLAWTKITGTPTTLAGYGITDGVSSSRTLTINGVTYDLTANRSWSVGTVTSIATTGPLTGGTITGSGTIGITQSGASSDGYLSSTDWNTFNNKQNALTNPVTGTGTIFTLPMWSGATSLVDSPLSYGPDAFNFQYNSATGGTVNFTNIGLTAYTYSIQMNNFGSPRSTVHSYTDGVVVQSIAGTQVSRMFANGNFILGDGAADNGYKLAVEGNVYIETIANAITDTDRFIVSDGGVIKYRTGTELLGDIGAQGSITLTTTGTSGAATLIGNTLNIPQYTDQFVGTVTSVAALTLGTSGTDLSSTVANSTTTPVITLNVPTASAVNRGALSSADWTTFNNKQPAGNYITSLIGEATATGPGAASVTLDNTAVIGKVLTGLNVTGGTIISTDNILSAFGKVQNQINGLIGGSIFQGTWNASTNTPTLTSGVGTNGHYYIVSADGSTNLDGITDWKVGDWAIFAGTTWEKIDNTDAVNSVNGYTGIVSLVTGDVLEGAGTLPGRPSQLYFTDARSRAAISLTTTGTSGPATYSNVTGIFNIPNYTTDLTGYVPYTGATQNLNLGTFGLIGDFVQFNTAPTSLPTSQGTMYWDTDKETIDVILNGTTGSIFQDTFFFVKNQTGTLIPKGTVVRAAGTVGASGRILIAPFLANGTFDSKFCLGVTTENIADGDDGRVTYFGAIRKINTSAYANGTVLYASPSTAGGFTATEPSGPTNNIISVAFVVYSDATNGEIFVRPTFVPSAIDISKSLNYTPANAATTLTINGVTYDLSANRSWSVGTVTSIATTGPITGGTITGSGTIGITQATSTIDGYLSSTDWNTFNGKQNAITLTTTGTSGVSTLIGSTLNIPNYTTDLSGYVTLDTTQTITGLKTILRGGDVLNFKIGTDTLYGLKIAYNQNELAPAGEATWSFVNTFNNGSGTGLETTPISFFRGVLVTGERLLSSSVNSNLLSYYASNPTGRYPIYAYNTGVQQFASSIIVGETTGVVNPSTGAIADLPSGVVANFKGRVIGSDAVNNNEFATLGQVTSTSRAAISLTTTGTSGPATYSSVTGVLNIPEYQGGVTSFNTRTGAVTLTSSDVTTALGYTPVTDARTLSINGVTYDLTANRSWTVGVNPSAREIQTYIATASQTTFTVTGGYTVGLVDVFINGVRLTSSDYTATNGTTVVLAVGTMAGNIVDIIKYTSGIVNSISGTGTTNELAYFTASTTIASLTTATYPSLTELSYVKGVTSSIQTQIDGKQNALTNPVTGTGTTNYLPKFTGSTTIGNSALQETNGNLGLGVTPSAWGLGKAIEIGNIGNSVWGVNATQFNVLQNVYYDAVGFKYASSNAASYYQQASGAHAWYTAPSGTAGNAITFSTPMILTSGGNLLVGTTTDAGAKFQVSGVIKSTFNSVSFQGPNNHGFEFVNATTTTKALIGGYDSTYGAYIQGVNFGVSYEKLLLNPYGGNVGIGTTTPVSKLDVNIGVLSTAGAFNNAALNLYNPTNIGAYSQITFGYTIGATYASSYLGFVSTNQGSFGFGDLVFGTRSVNTDTQATERMRITSGGNVGIGVAPNSWGSSFRPLQMGSYGSFITGRTDDNSMFIGKNVYFDGSNWIGTTTGWAQQIVFDSSGNTIFRNANVTANTATGFNNQLYLTSGGNVLIGTTADSGYKMTVNSSGSGILWATNGSANSQIFLSTANNLIITNGNSQGVILNNGATSWAAYSDIRLKNIIGNIDNSLDAIKSLSAIKYTLKSDLTNKKRVGLIAQEVQKVLPESVEVDEKGMLSVRYTELIPLLTAAIQELKAELDELKSKN